MNNIIRWQTPEGILEIIPTAQQGPGENKKKSSKLQEAVRKYHLWEFEAAAAIGREILAETPDDVDAMNLVGVVSLHQGRLVEAESLFRQAMVIEPGRSELFRNLAATVNLSSDGPEVAMMQELLAKGNLADPDLENFHFTLAKIFDQGNMIDEAFHHVNLGNTIHRRASHYNPGEIWQYIDEMERTFDAGYMKRRFGTCGIDVDLPIFIVGMPRSGSTLIEQIIAAHPQAHGADELKLMPRFCQEIRKAAPSMPITKAISLIDDKTVRFLAGRYLDHIRSLAPEALRITDKMPHNFLRLGMIALMFPRARIIDCRRDPLETCISCYFHQFPEGLEFTHDMAEIGDFYKAYLRIMEHWHAVLPLHILEISYEDLVADQETISRRIIDFCGLPWNDQCLAFHKHKRTITTSSRLQVNQPLHQKFLGRWRRYDRFFAPLKESLGIDK